MIHFLLMSVRNRLPDFVYNIDVLLHLWYCRNRCEKNAINIHVISDGSNSWSVMDSRSYLTCRYVSQIWYRDANYWMIFNTYGFRIEFLIFGKIRVFSQFSGKYWWGNFEKAWEKILTMQGRNSDYTAFNRTDLSVNERFINYSEFYVLFPLRIFSFIFWPIDSRGVKKYYFISFDMTVELIHSNFASGNLAEKI